MSKNDSLAGAAEASPEFSILQSRNLGSYNLVLIILVRKGVLLGKHGVLLPWAVMSTSNFPL